MSFEVAQDATSPEQTTVASYAVGRLTSTLTMQTGMVETRRGWTPIPVLAAVDTNTDGVFEELHVPSGVTLTPGQQLVTTESDVVGVVGSVVLVAASGPNAAFFRVTLASGGLASSAPVNLQTATVNCFGNQVMNPAPNGRSWSLALSSDNPLHAARMIQMMVDIQAALVAKTLAAFGISKTGGEIQAAVAAMFAAGDSVDSIIASEMEQLEKDRRSGVFTASTVVGSAPAV